MDTNTLHRLINSIPPEAIAMRNSGQLHKLASQRSNIEDFGLDTAIGHLAKKAYYRRRINSAILEGIAAVNLSSNK